MARKAPLKRLSIGPMDDGARGSIGVTVSAMELGNGRVRIHFDDVDHVEGKTARGWKHRVFVTSLELDGSLFDEASLTDEEFAGLGRTLLGYLSARMEILRRKAGRS